MREAKTCPICGTEFSPRNPRRVYCSRECQLRRNSIVSKRRYVEDEAYRERIRRTGRNGDAGTTRT